MGDRYTRQIRLDEVGKAGQKKLTEAKVLPSPLIDEVKIIV